MQTIKEIWKHAPVIPPMLHALVKNMELAGRTGNPRDMSSFQQPKKKAYQGICLAIIRPETTSGRIIVTATSEGLKEASLVITAI